MLPNDLNFERLEERNLLAASIGFDLNTGQITMIGDTVDDQAYVRDLGGNVLEVEFVGVETQQFTKSDVTSIRFFGGLGNDQFYNQTDVASTASGNQGNDVLSGGSGPDTLYGGPGQDDMDGNAGADYLAGGENADDVNGGDGNDFVYGGFGDDQVFGGLGDDYVAGDWDNDTVDGGDGNDYMLGFSGDDILIGGPGNDLMYGQHGQDLLFGDDGDDRVRGGPDQDELHGGADDDYMMGDQEDDVMYGDSGSDTMLGYLGNDTIDGGDGSDFLYGQSGDDTIVGGDGDDVATGEDGDDRISGDAGNDLIYGFADDDWLRGGSGNDWMLGGDGDDAMFGGSGVDTMFGQADDDRFLTRSGDSVRDQSVDDAIVMFEDQTSNWTDAEIEVLDLGFEQLHDRTQNTALLRDPLTTNPLTFYKYSSLGGAAGINYLSWSTSCNFSGCTTTYHREIRIADWDETNSFYNYAYQYVGIHELAHNWDSDLEFTSAASTLAGLWNQFLAISDWQQSNPGSGYSQSLDGNWWYLSSASFAENYGRTNPNEDMATSWEYYFTDYQDPNLNHSNLQSKMDILDQVFNALM